jgi:hypothetical protein
MKETELIMFFTIFSTYWAIRMTESRTMRCKGRVARMGDEKCAQNNKFESPKGGKLTETAGVK